MTENKNATMYLNMLIKKETETAKELKAATIKLKSISLESLCYVANMLYSFQLPEDVSLLLINLATTQVEHNERVNIQKVLQPLSRNQRQNIAMVMPLYEKAMEKYSNMTSTTNIQATENDIENKNESKPDVEESKNKEIENEKNQKTNEYIVNLPQKIKLEKQRRDTQYLTSDSDKVIVINPMRIPKQGWVINVYAKSYEDYCDVVKTTLEDFKNNNMTIFLTKPDAFSQEIATTKKAIAYSVLINDNFSFVKLEEKTILKLDEKDVVDIENEIPISGRVGATMKLFGATKFSDKNGRLLENNKDFLDIGDDVDEILNAFEEIGANENIVKYYIEIMTGISMSNCKQFYKSIVFDTDEMEDILEIVEKYDPHNLDFIADTNKEDVKILFIHKDHLRPLVKELIDEEFSIQINPVFDEFII